MPSPSAAVSAAAAVACAGFVWALAACCCVGPNVAEASLQGLYAVQPSSGQLQRIDWMTGNTTNIGTSLQRKGWHVADCTPADIDRTGKWIFVLAKPISQGSSSRGLHDLERTPWSLLGILLADGTVRTTQQLPSIFPASMDACEHVVSVNSGWDAIVTAVAGQGTPDPRLTVALFNYTFPTTRSVSVLVNQSLAAFHLGGWPQHPSACFDTNMATIWVQLEHGLLECSVVSGTCNRTLSFHLPEAGSVMTGLQYLQGSFVRVSEGTSSLGVIEMGGGSTQVTFEVKVSLTACLGARHGQLYPFPPSMLGHVLAKLGGQARP